MENKNEKKPFVEGKTLHLPDEYRVEGETLYIPDGCHVEGKTLHLNAEKPANDEEK